MFRKHEEYRLQQSEFMAVERFVRLNDIFEPLSFEVEALYPEDLSMENPSVDLDVKEKRLRRSYSIKQKHNFLRSYAIAEQLLRARLGSEALIWKSDVITLASKLTGVPSSTLKDWLAAKSEIEELYENNKRLRKSKRLGAGRHPFFPASEKAVARLVRDRRKDSKLVSKRFVIKALRKEAWLFWRR